MPDHDDGDPHDLSFPKRHFPRSSMVDNLVMSLDQYSSTSETSRERTSHPESRRYLGHHHSLSISHEGEIKAVGPAEIARAASAAEQIPNIFGEEEETQREKVYNAQRAAQPIKPIPTRANFRARTRSGSNTSSADLSHLASFAGHLGPAGNRRSQSFDFGSVRPKMVEENIDTGRISTIPYAPEFPRDVATATNGAQTVARRNSGRSAKSTQTKKTRPGTVTNNNLRFRTDSPQPSPMLKSQTYDSLDGKVPTTTHPEHISTPKAGFFRRVFGSSNKPASIQSTSSSPVRGSHDRNGSPAELRRPNSPSAKLQKHASPDRLGNKENQPSISKKPSSFFRRRKKSTSSGVPPPLPLKLNNSLDNSQVEAGQSSPVSSLRAFMDPYLANGHAAGPRHARGSSLQSVQNVDGASDSVQHDGPEMRSRSRVERSSTGHRKTPSQGVTQNLKDTAKWPINTKDTITMVHSANASESHSIPKSMNVIETQASTSAQVEPVQDQDQVTQTNTNESSNESADTTTTTTTTTAAADENVAQTAQDDVDQVIEDAGPAEVSSSANTSGRIVCSSSSELSDYKSAPSTPLVTETPDTETIKSPRLHVSHPSLSEKPGDDHLAKVRKIFENTDEEVNFSNASAWLGEASTDREQLRNAYMSLFDWKGQTILAAFRNLCSKLALRGETQQVDRILYAFSSRWCECNANHGFKSDEIVHTICYSILLLNTDLHLADIGKKITRTEFVRNAMEAIKQNSPDLENKQETPRFLTVRSSSNGPGASGSYRPSMDRSTSSLSTTRPSDWPSRDDIDEHPSGPLVEAPFTGPQSGWELQVESILKEFYFSISRDPLPLFGAQPAKITQQSNNNLSALSTLRRTPSTLSKTTTDSRGRYPMESRSLGARWATKARSRPRLGSAQAFGSSRTSIDDQSSAWSPALSSTWSKASLNKTLTSMSVDSFGTEYNGAGYQSSIGFANALSQSNIRDEHFDDHPEEHIKAIPLLEDDSLELYGAPWAKEGILKHKCHLEGVDKRSKDRNWNDCFAVIERGWMRLFSFSMTAKSLRTKARNQKAGGVVGGGNWQDSAEEVWKFMLRHTIASSLPPPGYSKQRPYVWALSLPNGAVHLFSVGTPDIVKEFVSTANFWSARLSKEPMTGGISSMEYGWSDNVVNKALIGSETHPALSPGIPRPSTQLSMRSSIDHASMRPKLPGDKVHISEWTPPQQSLMASQLLEIDQLKALQAYVKNIEDELSKHNELRAPMLTAFSTRHPNSQKAMMNWEKKSSYLLQEVVKFGTYVEALQAAQTTKDKVDKMKKEREQEVAQPDHA